MAEELLKLLLDLKSKGTDLSTIGIVFELDTDDYEVVDIDYDSTDGKIYLA